MPGASQYGSKQGQFSRSGLVCSLCHLARQEGGKGVEPQIRREGEAVGQGGKDLDWSRDNTVFYR